MFIPERCFCGCGTPRKKSDLPNLEGVTFYLELGKWLSFLSIMEAAGEAAGGDSDWSDAEDFMNDGRVHYKRLYDEVHEGIKVDRRARKVRNRWEKQSRKAIKQLSRSMAPEQPNPFEADPPTPQEVRAWVFEGTLLSMDLS